MKQCCGSGSESARIRNYLHVSIKIRIRYYTCGSGSEIIILLTENYETERFSDLNNHVLNLLKRMKVSSKKDTGKLLCLSTACQLHIRDPNLEPKLTTKQDPAPDPKKNDINPHDCCKG